MLLDAIDSKIVAFLKDNGRMPFLQIAKKLGVSESTVRKRVARLQSNRVIMAFTISLEPSLSFQCIIAIKCEPKATKKIVEKVKALRPLSPVYEVTGRFDVFCNIEAPTARELNELIDKIRDVPGVTETESFMVVEKT